MILVGDTYVGKSALVTSYARDQFPLDYTPTVFEQYEAREIKSLRLNGASTSNTFTLNIMDSSGLPDHKAIR